MLIGELAKKANVSRDTVRYYERRGLIDVVQRRENQYKEYADNSPDRLAFIHDMQEMGFTLADTRIFLSLIENGAATCENTAPTIAARLEDIDCKIARLKAMRARMKSAFKKCSASTNRCSPIANGY